MKRISLFLMALSFSTVLSFAQSIDSTAIDQIFSAWDKEAVPGCALGIMKAGKLIYARGYGLANLEYNIPNTVNSVFRIASTSKQFTAACVVLLAEQGKLDLEHTLDQFFPDFPAYAKTITVRHLLNHTSGIRDYLTLASLKGLEGNDYYEDEDVMDWLLKQQGLNFKPGDEFLYSNSGYWLLGQIVNEVTGMNMADFAKKEIFDPLGMSNTHFHNNHRQVVKNRASGYAPTREGTYRISMTTLDMIGDGGVFTTINDIKKWDEAYHRDHVLSKDFWKMMTQVGVLNDGEVLSYAAGLDIGEYRGLKRISHGGAFVGYRAEFLRFPEQQLAIAIFANRADANPTGMAYQVAALLLEGSFDDTSAEAPQLKKKERPRFVSLSTKELERFAGHYWNDRSLLARKIYLKNDTLRYWRSARSESLLAPISKNEFKMLNVGADVVVKFYQDRAGHKRMSFSQNNSEPSVSKAYEPKTYTKKELTDFVGTYYSKELAINYEIKFNNEVLTLYMGNTEVAALQEIMARVFSLNRFGTLQFSVDRKGEVTAFSLAAGRVKNLVFEKQ